MEEYNYETSAPWGHEIKTVTIKHGVTSIGDMAFSDCSSLTSISIPNSVTSIGGAAFAFCDSLTNITIPNSVTGIGESTFSYCSSLTSVTIPNGICDIGDMAFFDCSSLTIVTISNNDTIPDNITATNGMTRIGVMAFKYCRNLTSITLPSNITSIEGEAFSNCSSLASITIPNNVTSIGVMAFDNCINLTSITIPNSVTSIGDSAFAYCESLRGIYVDENNSFYSSDSHGVLFNKDKTELLACPGGLSGVYTVPNSVTTISSNAFHTCEGLESITIPSSVTSIEDMAFGLCVRLKEIRFRGEAPSISPWAWPFFGVTATAYYPVDNSTWTADVMQDYGGSITWVPYTPGLDNVVINKVIPHRTGNILYWDAVEGADIYQIYRLNGSNWELLKNTRSLGYKDETAKVGVKHYYKIVARNGSLKSDIKTTVSASAIRPDTKLGNVTIYKTIGHSSGNILYWNAVDGAKLYQVYRLNGTTWELLKNTGSLGYKDESAPKGVACYYKIVARNGDIKSDIRTTTSTRVVRAK